MQFIKDWTLIISILTGIASYFLYVNLPFLDGTHVFVNEAIAIIQPALIFVMLFLTFCRVDPRELRLRRWHAWLLLFQCGMFTSIGFVLMMLPHSGLRVVLEGAMICLICPTATAAAVITRKLDGDVPAITSYTILINLATAILVPAIVPLVHNTADVSVVKAAMMIMGKVFPLLLMPLVAAVFLRYTFPRACRKVAQYQELSFYLWAFSLSLALAVSTRSVVHSTVDIATMIWLVVVSLVCCALQFYLGRKIGAFYGDKVTAGQALGQKNTILAIWMGYTFFTPVTAVVGGFYSIWHNVVNSYQLYRHHHLNNR